MAITDDQIDDQFARGVRGHWIVFYDSQAEYVESVGAHLEQGLRAGDAVVVIATPSHREALSRGLTNTGIDVERAQAAGALTMLDAAEILASCMAEDRPDPTRFTTALNAILAKAARGGNSVRMFGEMVGVLWEAGNVAGAMDLESFWNELLPGSGASLLCAYSLDTVGLDVSAKAEMCGLHCAVLRRPSSGQPVVRSASVPLVVRNFAGVLDDVTRARHFVVDALCQSGHGRVADNAGLVVTELAANAIEHACSTFTVTVSTTRGGIEIAVSDCGPLVPRLTEPEAFEANGRGLRLVAAIATSWGTTPDRVGKVVWAELCRPSSS